MPAEGSVPLLLTVGRFEWFMEACLARCRLATCGIEAHIPEEHFGSLYWHYAKAIGGFRLQVSAGEAEDARAILDDPGQEGFEPLQTGSEELADRLLRATVFGAVTSPVQVYALWLMVKLFGSPARLDERARRSVARAVPLIAVFACAALLMLGLRFRH
jgi:hypothetical protein